MKIFNCTQHKATPEQIANGVVELREELREELKALLTFTAIPSEKEMQDRAYRIADLIGMSGGVVGVHAAMIGGAPFFMRPLEEELIEAGFNPVYAFSQRESVEQIQEDGSVLKKNVFKHIGFVKI